MRKFALIDEMCRRSEAGTVMFKKAYGSFREEIQEMATKYVDRRNDAQNSAQASSTRSASGIRSFF